MGSGLPASPVDWQGSEAAPPPPAFRSEAAPPPYSIIGAAAAASGLTVEQVLNEFGRYFVSWIQTNGFDKVRFP